jgi:tRNA A-37 threonylcarbamoyl transferase component Bud32
VASVFRRGARPEASASAVAAPPVQAAPIAPGEVEQAPTPRLTRDLEGVVLDERYRIGALIGEGGMATVHTARDLLLRRDVAVKIFRTRALNAEELQLQEAEARVIASLNHHSLTTLFDAGVETVDGGSARIYLVMEHVIGTDLRTRLRSGPLEVAEAAWLGFDMAEALDYVHQSGFVHRDVKPANVLLSNLRSAKPIVGKLADFGIATLIGKPDTNEFTVGTAAYLSPEQVEGLDAGPESDVYSLGLVLLEAMTGRVEYPGTVVESAFARLDRSPTIPDRLPAKVADVLRGMTQTKPADRIALSAAALQLQQFLVDELIRSRELDPALLAGDEAARVAALAGYDILDTDPDAVFDAITRLAGRLLDTPIALITLVDLDRVWFKSTLGWDGQEVGRDIAFCSTTNPGTSKPWTIPDALEDSRTVGNPLVAGGPEVRAYAGAPLVTRDGHNLGAVCVFDRRPRDFTPEQMESLGDLADLAMHEMEMRKATRRALFADS